MIKQNQVCLMASFQDLRIQLPINKNNSYTGETGQATSRSSLNNNQKFLFKKYVTKQIIEECLCSMDLFSKLMNQSQQQRRKIRRDVEKSLKIQIYHQQQVIYDIGQQAQKLFLIIEGTVSVLIQKSKSPSARYQTEHQNDGKQSEIEQKQYEEVNVYEQGTGFGEGQFIAKRKRDVRTVCKSQDVVLGVLDLQKFIEVIQLYRLRVYYKKRDRFQDCIFFSVLSQDRLEFLINNSKVVKLKRGQYLFKQNSPVRFLYLLTKGQLKLSKKIKQPYRYGTLSKNQFTLPDRRPSKQVIIGILQKDNFIGDMQIVLGKDYQFAATCQSLTAQLYACDTRIIMNQIASDHYQTLFETYSHKKNHYEGRVKNYETVKKNYQSQHQIFLIPQLTKKQRQIKRRLKHKYVEKRQSAIGSSSASDIQKLVRRKKSLLSPQAKSLQFPVISVFLSHSSKKRQYQCKSFSPVAMVKIPKVRTQISTRLNDYDQQKADFQQSKSMVIDLRPIPKKIKLKEDQTNRNIKNLKKILKKTIQNPQMKEVNEAIRRMRRKLIDQQEDF